MAEVVADAEGRIHMLNDAGSPVSVAPEEYHQAIAAGWRPQTAEEFNKHQTAREQSGIGQTALAAGEGALETATLGAGTAAAGALGGEEYREKRRERAEYHPTARTVGQVAGAVLPGLLSGGEGTVGAIARATPAGALSRLGGSLEGAVASGLERAGIGGESLVGAMAQKAFALGAQGGLEGAGFGLGQSLADSALEGTDWTAERALAGLENGALWGFTGGALIGAGGVAVSRAGKAAAEAMLGEGTSLRQTVQNWADRRTLKSLVGEDSEAFRKITRNGEQMERIPELAAKVRARGVTEAADIPSAVQGEIEEAAGIAKTIEQAADAQGLRPDTRALLDEVNGQVERLKEVGTPDHMQMARMIQRKVARLEESVKPVEVVGPDGVQTFQQTGPTFEELRKFKTGLGEITNFARAHRNVAQGELSKLYGTVARTLEDTAGEMGEEAGTAYRGAMRDMDDFITIRSAMKREATRQARAKFVQAGDINAGIGGALASLVLGHGGPMAALAGIATSAASKFIRQRGDQAIGKLADYALKMEGGMKAAAEKMAGIGTFDRAALRAGMQFAPKPERDQAEFDDVQRLLFAYQQNPQAIADHVATATHRIAAEQPEVAMAMSKQLVGDYAYLSSLVPPPMTRAQNSLTPMKEKPTWTPSVKSKVVNAARGLAAPQSVWRSVADGHVNWDGLEALKQRRPQLWNDMRSHVIKAMNAAPEPPPFRRRVLLGLAFDFNADWSMANVQSIQAEGAQPPDTGNGKPAMAGVSTDALDLPGQKPPEAA